MIEQRNEGAENNVAEDSFMGAFDEHFQEFEQAKSEGLGSLQELAGQEELLNPTGMGTAEGYHD